MYRLDLFARDKNGNKGSKITSCWYSTEKEAKNAKFAIIQLCKNQYQIKKEWKLKSCIIEGPVYDEKYT